MEAFDRQLSEFREEFLTKVKIDSKLVDKVATTLRTEILANLDQIRTEINSVSPVSLKTRLEELHSFQTMMDTFNKMKPRPEIVRTQVIAQNYICFVYLKDTLFEVLRKNSRSGTVTKRCTKFLVDNPIRAFRNSIAHGNWKYLTDFSGIEFWAHKDGKPEEGLIKYTVSNDELNFWQMLARTVAYTTFLTLEEKLNHGNS